MPRLTRHVEMAGTIRHHGSSSTRRSFIANKATPISKYAEWFIEEGMAEGVRGDIAFAQAVLETGGFANNKEWIKKHTGFDLGANLFPVGNTGKTGDGLRMAWEVGAAEEGVETIELFRVAPVGAEFAMGCVDAGADAVAVHGRTRAEGYSGAADWSIIARVARAVPVPVLGNGDVDSPEAAARMLDETGCAAVMVGRAALGNPWVFRRALSFISTGRLLPEPEPGERIAMAMRHLKDVAAFKGDETAASQMRKHLAWYMRGLKGAARVREAIMAAPTVSALQSVLAEYLLVFDHDQC